MKRDGLGHPKVVRLGRLLAIDRCYAVGILESLWGWAAKWAPQGDVGRHDDQAIADGIGYAGDAPALIKALVDARLVDEVPDPHRLVIHDIRDHADNSWRENLARNSMTWWDGSPPRLDSAGRPPRKLQGNSKETPRELGRNSTKLGEKSTLPDARCQMPDASDMGECRGGADAPPPTPSADRTLLRNSESESGTRAAEPALPGIEASSSPPPQKRRARPSAPDTSHDDAHLAGAGRVAALLAGRGVTVTRWQRVTPARRRMCTDRMRLEQIESPNELWSRLEALVRDIDGDCVRDWLGDIEILIRAGAKIDHWQRLVEGAYRRRNGTSRNGTQRNGAHVVLGAPPPARRLSRADLEARGQRKAGP